MNKASLVLLALGGLLFMTNTRMPRGIRNNNAGNIRSTGNWQEWQGAIDSDGSFIIFDTAENGLRAMARILRNYRDLYQLNTVEQIISRWAPPVENDTASYIQSASSAIGVAHNQPLETSDYPALMAAITRHENGVQPYSNNQIMTGFERGFA